MRSKGNTASPYPAASEVSTLRKWQYMFQSEQMWFVYTALYCETEWEEVSGRMSVLKKIEQRLNMKFLVKFGKSGAEINKMPDKITLKHAMFYKWMKCFQDGHTGIGDDEWSGRPSSSHTEENVDQIHTLATHQSANNDQTACRRNTPQ